MRLPREWVQMDRLPETYWNIPALSERSDQPGRLRSEHCKGGKSEESGLPETK